jgi:sugar diacid utilization regulator
LIRATAEITGCRVVLEERGGASLTAAPPTGSGTVGDGGAPVRATVVDGRTVRLERVGGSAPGDAELADVLAAFLTRHLADVRGGATDVPSDSPRSDTAATGERERAELVDVVLSATENDPDRSRALRALGLRSDQDVIVVAVAGPRGADVATATSLFLAGRGGLRPAVTMVGDVAAAVMHAPARDASMAQALRDRISDPYNRHVSLFAGLRVGVGRAVPALRARCSWDQAQKSLRFAGAPGIEPVADHAELGVLTLFARFDPATLAEVPEVTAVNEYRRRPTGPQDLAVVDVFCRTGSLRRAAAALHMHHSTVQPRIERVEQALGWDLTQSRQRLRARMTFIVCRLAESDYGSAGAPVEDE